MKPQPELLTLEGIDLPRLGGEQKEIVLRLVNAIRTYSVSIEKDRFDLCIKISELDNVINNGPIPHGSYESIREGFFPEISERSLQRYTAIGRLFGKYREQVQEIGFSYLGKLAEQEKLIPVRSELIEEIRSGGTPNIQQYRSKIKALISLPVDRVKTDRGDNSDLLEHEVNKSRSKKSMRKESFDENERLDDRTRDLVDQLVPKDFLDQKRLSRILDTGIGRKKVVEYMIERLKDLLKYREQLSTQTGIDNTSETTVQ